MYDVGRRNHLENTNQVESRKGSNSDGDDQQTVYVSAVRVTCAKINLNIKTPVARSIPSCNVVHLKPKPTICGFLHRPRAFAMIHANNLELTQAEKSMGF